MKTFCDENARQMLSSGALLYIVLQKILFRTDHSALNQQHNVSPIRKPGAEAPG